jgi:hypothetical protein
MIYVRSVLDSLCSPREVSSIGGIVNQTISAPIDEPFKIPDAVRSHAAWHRLEEQLSYYTSRARSFQKRYQFAKIMQILLGAAIPVLAAVPGLHEPVFKLLSALFGATIATIEAVLQLFQWHALSLQYRSTAERLKRERWLLLAGAEPYVGIPSNDALVLLAARTNALLSNEHESWLGTQANRQAAAGNR